MTIQKLKFWILLCNSAFCILHSALICYAQEVKEPNVAGAFYPDNPQELSRMVDGFLDSVNPKTKEGNIFALISPHAGYQFSGQVAAYGYKLIRNVPYTTVIVMAPSHYFGFTGASVYSKGAFKTPLGVLEIDQEFAQKLLNKNNEIFFEPSAFQKEHSIEVQLPFLQKVLTGFKIVPIAIGDCSLSTCQKLAGLLKAAIGIRKDVLIVASTDMYHGYDYEEAEAIDNLTLSYLKKMDAQGLYNGLREGKLQLCGGLPVVTTFILAKELGYNKLEVFKYTNSAQVTGRLTKGIWTVGYSSSIIDQAPLEPMGRKNEDMGFLTEQAKGDTSMLNKEQRKKLLTIARASIETYLKTGKKLELTESEPMLLKEMGAFVTLHERGELRGCIGSLVARGPLYLAVRDMAVEAAVGDPRFSPLTFDEFKNIEIEISALSSLTKVDSADKIKLGVHGVLVKRGFNSGVFLPQVAAETGWSKEEFLSSLCAHKAGLSPHAWKEKSTEIYIFTAEVFSEKSY